jgi:integrase
MQMPLASDKSRLRPGHSDNFALLDIGPVQIGARTEELRALTWDRLDLDGDPPIIQVWRSVRRDGQMKTARSRRTLELPNRCVEALRDHKAEQVKVRRQAGNSWVELCLVFCTRQGSALDAANVRRSFRLVASTAGLDPKEWTRASYGTVSCPCYQALA